MASDGHDPNCVFEMRRVITLILQTNLSMWLKPCSGKLIPLANQVNSKCVESTCFWPWGLVGRFCPCPYGHRAEESRSEALCLIERFAGTSISVAEVNLAVSWQALVNGQSCDALRQDLLGLPVSRARGGSYAACFLSLGGLAFARGHPIGKVEVGDLPA